VTSEAVTITAKAAAFFDVDGTLIRSTVVHYYVYFQRKRLSGVRWRLWYVAFALKCGYFLLLDRIDRGRFNIAFYRSYAGLPAGEIKEHALDCYREVIKPRQFRQAAACAAEHRRAGRDVVLVTGSIDFIVEPLASALGAGGVVAPSLVESNGCFTGELDGPPISQREKARRMRAFADAHGIDLSQSHAYGDSIADLPMLEAVGFPHAVNPDKKLAATAKARGWPMHQWTLPPKHEGSAR
jgi:HAD superfamily hydrolase (TIGR01490 family)